MGNSVDYVIVGAGTAGCVLADRLSGDAGTTVLVLEAGGADGHPLLRMPVGFLKALQRPEFIWRYRSEPEPELLGRVIDIPRGRVLGGSSSINGMFHIRGHARDFDDWRDLGCEGWGYADVLPYFKRSEANWRGDSRYHSGKGPLTVSRIDTRKLLSQPLMEAARRAGYAVTDDYDGELQEGFALGDVAIDRRGRRASTARAYLHPAMNRPNLTVETQAVTRRILFEKNRAVGVEYRRNGRLVQIRARREVILAGGAFASPHLLMLSGVGPADMLRRHGISVVADSPGVGRNLIEHPRMPLRFKATAPVTFANELRLDRAALSALRWAVFGSGPFATQICSGTVLLKTDPVLDRPDIQLLCNPVGLDANLWFPGLIAPKEHSFYITVCMVHQRSRGRVELRSADPAEPPRIFLNLFSEPEDFRTMRDGILAGRAIYRTPPQAGLTGEELQPGEGVVGKAALDDSIRRLAGITHHPVGTCKMGIDEMAVVDPGLKVIGVEGLRVADASIMPTIPGANTNAATVMIGEKAADLILGRFSPVREAV